MSIVRKQRPVISPAGTFATIRGYAPANLQHAYKVVTAAARRGRGRTVAIVDAFNDPRAAADLAIYRAHYHLGRCTLASGCLRIVNQRGFRGPLPKTNSGWAAEESLDLDMVSAICPRCHILLVEAHDASTRNLGFAENRAVAMGARFVSNSWSGGEFVGQDGFNHFFNHAGVAVDFASGDFGEGAAYPTDLQFVTAVGGTTLRRARNARGWSETVWGSRGQPGFPAEGTGSGCSVIEAKPSWQRADARSPDGCLNRTENDVAADANPSTGAAVYDSLGGAGLRKGWNEVGGTSEATPIITAMYALAATPDRGTYPSQYLYLHSKHLFDVTTGQNGICETFRAYLCHGVRGYDGPTGLGTPNGTKAFTGNGAHRVTVIDPGVQDRAANSVFSLGISGLDTRRGASLSYSAIGLPPGLAIHAVPRSTRAIITGTLSAAGTWHITVIARDGLVQGITHFDIVAVPSLRASGVTPAQMSIDGGALCLDNTSGVAVQSCASSASQKWAYQSAGGPNDEGTLTIGGQCLSVSGTSAVLAGCTGSASEHWQFLVAGVLANIGAGKCLAAPSFVPGTPVVVRSCNGSQFQTWTLPAGPLVNGVLNGAGATCLHSAEAVATQVTVAACDGTGGQQWVLAGDATIRDGAGLCLDGNSSVLDGTAVVVAACTSSSFPQAISQQWFTGLDGQLVNGWSGKCLADSGNGKLTQQDCFGQAGEIWGLN
jgi:ricin-type beta-trefoil lectin protein/subtilase family protein